MINAKRNSSRKGASAVEFALVFPLVLTFFTALIAFSQAMLLRDTSQYAAYRSAREGINLYATNESVVDTAEEILRIMRIRNALVSVSPNDISSTTQKVTVSVQIPFADNAWVAGGFIPGNWTVGSDITLTKTHHAGD